MRIFQVYLPEPQLAKLEVIATRLDVSKAELVRQALALWLAEQDEDDTPLKTRTRDQHAA